jgi:hypothetical protein
MFEQLSDKQMVEFFNTHYPTASDIVNGTINKQQRQILIQVLNGKYRSTELVKKLGVPDRALKRHLAILIENGCILFDGPYKTGGYIPTTAFLDALTKYTNE